MIPDKCTAPVGTSTSTSTFRQHPASIEIYLKSGKKVTGTLYYKYKKRKLLLLLDDNFCLKLDQCRSVHSVGRSVFHFERIDSDGRMRAGAYDPASPTRPIFGLFFCCCCCFSEHDSSSVFLVSASGWSTSCFTLKRLFVAFALVALHTSYLKP